MKTDIDSLPWKEYPFFLPQTETILQTLRTMDGAELKKLWKCNDQIAELNIHRLQSMDLRKNLTPAVLAYEGIQYQYMAPGVFTQQEFSYIQEHLRILSGFYGILQPFDGVTPYRLEMQAPLKICNANNLYNFWNKKISNKLFSETNCIINLASKEYSLCVSRYLTDSIKFITCIFGEEKNGKIMEKGTMCKMARGEMVRFMAENAITSPEQLTSFSRLNYQFSPDYSTPSTYVFIQKE